MPMNDAPTGTGMTLPAAADLQDHLLTVTNDLARLQTLLSAACAMLLKGFCGAAQQLSDHRADAVAGPVAVSRAMEHLGDAVTALQFQDMASQLIEHTSQRLRHCTDRLARDAFGGDEDGSVLVAAAPMRPNPVTQDEMDAGSIDLF
jgi:hypothetical protein